VTLDLFRGNSHLGLGDTPICDFFSVLLSPGGEFHKYTIPALYDILMFFFPIDVFLEGSSLFLHKPIMHVIVPLALTLMQLDGHD
jgi:hypothetical protein